MKYRLLDLLTCARCGLEFNLSVEVVSEDNSSRHPQKVFTCTHYCSRFNLIHPKVSEADCVFCSWLTIERGSIFCKKCLATYTINKGVPDFTESSFENKDKYRFGQGTSETYSFLWKGIVKSDGIVNYHYDNMQAVIPEEIVCGEVGLELGCGPGMDTWVMSGKKPDTEIIAIDISEGVYKAQQLNSSRKNVHIIRGDILILPFRSDTFDFCYSFGAIHHTVDPCKCFNEISKVLKPSGKTFLYLYEDHEDNLWKKYSIKVVSLLRKASSGLNKPILYSICFLGSPVIYLTFTLPAILFKHFNRTRKFAEKIPFNFGTGPFSLAGDLFDRFGVPIEIRFNRIGLRKMLKSVGFLDIQFSKLQRSAGIVAWAKKYC